MYTARIPFKTPRSTRITEIEASLELGGVQYLLKWDGHYHVLVVSGLPSQDVAERFTKRAQAAFAWLLLQKGMAAEVNLDPQKVTYFEDPIRAAENIAGSLWSRVDGMVNGDQTAIFPSDKEIKVATGFPADVYVTMPTAQVLQTLVEGAERQQSSDVADDARFSVAIALYGAYFTERTAKARFLTLVMALESLAIASPKAPIALELLGRWQQDLNVLRSSPDRTADELASLESLERELLFRKNDSVRSQIRHLVRTTLATRPDVEQVSRTALRLYDLRSRLVHEGYVPPKELDEATSEVKELVHKVLVARFEAVASQAEQ